MEPIVDVLVVDLSIFLHLILILELVRVIDMACHAVAPLETVEVVRDQADDRGPELTNMDIHRVSFLKGSRFQVTPEPAQPLHSRHLECRSDQNKFKRLLLHF